MTTLLNDPALIVGLVRATLILLVSFGFALTQEQQDSLLMFVGALLAVLSVVLTAVTVKLTTPKANPSVLEGTIVNVVTPEGEPNRTVVAV
jgi:hypothetical protein